MKKYILFLLLIVGGIVIFACLACFGLGLITSSLPTYKATATAQAVARATEAVKPSNTPALTPTPIPPTPQPTPTFTPKHQPTATPTPKPAKVGRAGAYVLTVNAIIDPFVSKELFASRPSEGYRYIVLDVTLENAGDKPILYNQFYFKVKDAQGFEYEPALVFSAPRPSFSSGQLSPGGKTRGYLAFEVAQTARGLKLMHMPRFFGEAPTITISLD